MTALQTVTTAQLLRPLKQLQSVMLLMLDEHSCYQIAETQRYSSS
jgi:hypothetical protein